MGWVVDWRRNTREKRAAFPIVTSQSSFQSQEGVDKTITRPPRAAKSHSALAERFSSAVRRLAFQMTTTWVSGPRFSK